MKTTLPDDAEILSVFESTSRRPLHVTDVIDRLGLQLTVRSSLSQALDAMASRGLLSPMPGSRYRLPRTSNLHIEGRFTQNPRGFGFVAADDGGADVYIPATSVFGAMHGDRVAVSAHVGPHGREGVVTRVVTRRPPRVPGTLRMQARGAWVEVDDARIRGPIPVNETGTARDGEAVVCEIVRWPEHAGELPVGRVQASLGRPGQLDVEVQKVLLREGVEETFPQGALDHAATLARTLTAQDLRRRVDLRAVPLLAIDPDDARDHDDAVHVAARPDGGFVATIAIADVSHYVTPGSGLNEAALARGTSIYLPDRAIPMLPHELSSHLASLVEGEDRLSLVVQVNLDATGCVQKSKIVEAVVRIHAGLTYGQVAHTMGWTDIPSRRPLAEQWRAEIATAAQLSELLRTRRMRRGAMDFDLPEARVRFGEDGKTPIDIVASRQDPGMRRAYNLIEELMLLGNEVIAELCHERGAPTLYRVHGAPESSGLVKFATVARAYGFDVDAEAVSQPKRLAAFLRKMAGTPAARVLGMVLLRSMPQAVYQVDHAGHFGLAAPSYLHFTSPIRRYPDIIAHRVVRQLARGERWKIDDESTDALRKAAAESSRLERRAMEIEREVMDLYRCVVAQAHLGEVHSGVVSGLSSAGPFVQLEQPFIDVLVRVADVAAGDWRLDDLGLRLTNERTGMSFALGDALVVQITDTSLPRRTVYATLPSETLETLRTTARARKPPRGAKGKPAGKKAGTHARSTSPKGTERGRTRGRKR